MGFSLKGAVSGALSGFSSGGGWAGAGIGAVTGGLLGGNDDEMTALQAYNMQKKDNIAFWHMQNAYNTPGAQMARYEKAGINPYMAISGGGVSAGNAGSIDAPTYNGSYAQPLSTTLTKALQNLNLRAMQADTKGKEVDTEMRELDLALKRARIAALLSGRARGYDSINKYGLRNPNNWTLNKLLPAAFNSFMGTSEDWDMTPNLMDNGSYSRAMLLGDY